ncbi:hypothetical protein ASG89_01075 [Paenibacillus sp. Soil766]|uniref:DUF3888 domain-containing protein n=1 Tax=Paenibacillus sp. Soil766 TaxID=1736404 RepID=UPI000708CEC3|nr:DUF3888 domain-containing protein [Paenibacillus sp. Soil766]KRF10161.1 hypothetical protein ASG89_01075 [Paenibacillus sp. Soil766]
MKSKIIFVVFVAFFAIATPIQASPNNQSNDELPCDVLKNAFVGTLFGSIGKVLSQYKDERQFRVDKMVEIKNLSSWGQYYWETTLKVTTFSGAHNPPYNHYTITFTNQNPEIQIKAIKVIQE